MGNYWTCELNFSVESARSVKYTMKRLRQVGWGMELYSLLVKQRLTNMPALLSKMPTKHHIRNFASRYFASCILAAWLMNENETFPFLRACLTKYGIECDDLVNYIWEPTSTGAIKAWYSLTPAALNTLRPHFYPSHPVIDAFLSLLSNGRTSVLPIGFVVPLVEYSSNRYALAVSKKNERKIVIYDSNANIRTFWTFFPRLLMWANALHSEEGGMGWSTSHRVTECIDTAMLITEQVDEPIAMRYRAVNLALSVQWPIARTTFAALFYAH